MPDFTCIPNTLLNIKVIRIGITLLHPINAIIHRSAEGVELTERTTAIRRTIEFILFAEPSDIEILVIEHDARTSIVPVALIGRHTQTKIL